MAATSYPLGLEVAIESPHLALRMPYGHSRGHTGKVLTTGPVTQVPWDEIASKSIEKQWKTIETERKITKNRSFHGPWPWEGGLTCL